MSEGTRGVHIVLDEAKAMQNMKLARSAPALKKSLERLVLAVAEMMTHSSGTGAAFVLGNLNHKA